MNKHKIERRIARGGARWHAPRMKGVVKNLGIKKIKKAAKA